MKSNRFVFIFAFLALTTLALPSSAQQTKTKTKNVDPSGTWRWESDQNGEITEHQLKVELTGKGKVKATYDGMLDDLKSVKGTIKGDQLTVDFEVNQGGRSFDAQYVGTIKGNKADGTIELSSDEGSMDLPWNATRTVELSDVVGKWNIVVEAQDGDHEVTLTVAEIGGKHMAVFAGNELSDCVVKDLKAKRDQFSFTVTGALAGTDFEAKCTTKPIGHKFDGDMLLEVSGESMELAMTGKRVQPSELEKLVGTWNLVIETPDGELEPTLVVTSLDGVVSAMLHSDAVGKLKAKGLKFKRGKLTFAVQGKMDGESFEAMCVSKVKGNKLKGSVALDLGGEEMELPLTGKLAK